MDGSDGGIGPGPTGAPDPANPAPPLPATPNVDPNWAKDWNGDWHAMVADAKKGRSVGDFGDLVHELRENGWSADMVRRMFAADAPGATPNQPTGQYVTPDALQAALQKHQQTSVQAMVEAMGKHMDHRDQGFRERFARDQRIADAERAEQEAIQESIKELGLPGPTREDGSEDPFGTAMYYEFGRRIQQYLHENKPEGLSEAEKELYMRCGSPEAIKAASDQMQVYRGMKYEMAAAVAGEQNAKTPPASLESGPAPKAEEKSFEQMTREEQTERVTEGIE